MIAIEEISSPILESRYTRCWAKKKKFLHSKI